MRKLANEHGVDLDAINGTGVGGRIRKQDVLEAARSQREQAAAGARPRRRQAPPAAPAAPAQAAAAAPEPVEVDTTLRGRTEKMSRLRQTIAKRMVESLQTAAQLTTVVEVDVTKIARLRDRAKADFQRREGVKLSFTAVLRAGDGRGAQAAPEAERRRSTTRPTRSPTSTSSTSASRSTPSAACSSR